jgi:hypothetical protein
MGYKRLPPRLLLSQGSRSRSLSKENCSSLGKVLGHFGRARLLVGLETILSDSFASLQGNLLQPSLFTPLVTSGDDLLRVGVGEQCLGNLLDRETSSKVDDHRGGQLRSELRAIEYDISRVR